MKLTNAAARYVRIQLTGKVFLHLDEVEVILAGTGANVALKRLADQSSVNQWSVAHRVTSQVNWHAATGKVLERNKKRRRLRRAES